MSLDVAWNEAQGDLYQYIALSWKPPWRTFYVRYYVHMTRSTDITSFTDFRARLRDHFDQQKKTGRALFVTTNGETEAVVLSPAAYDELIGQAELLESLALLDRSEDDIKAGRTRPAKEAIREIARSLNIELDR